MNDMNQELDRSREIELRRQEYERTFSYDGYQTTRKELFAHQRDPALTLRPDSITFNTACINSFENVVYIKIHVNKILQRIAITPCTQDDKNALRWCIAKPDKRKSRKITGKDFSEMIYKMMGWDTKKRYKMLGFKIKDKNGNPVYVFDLKYNDSAEIGKRRSMIKEETVITDHKESGTGQINIETMTKESTGSHLSENLTASFGDSVEETNRMMEDNSLDGYVTVETSKGERRW